MESNYEKVYTRTWRIRRNSLNDVKHFLRPQYVSSLYYWRRIATGIRVNTSSNNELAADVSKPLPEPMLTMGFCELHRPVSQEELTIWILHLSLKSIFVKSIPHLQGTNELIHWYRGGLTVVQYQWNSLKNGDICTTNWQGRIQESKHNIAPQRFVLTYNIKSMHG